MTREHRIRHLPVLEGGRRVSVFTAVDAMSAFAELLQKRSAE